MLGSNTSEIIEEAHSILGTDEEILGAGYFGMANLFEASMAGTTAGGLAGGLVGDEWTAALGAIAARQLAVTASTEAQGVTLQLIVAISEKTIHILNRDTGGRLRKEVVSFDRATVDIELEKLGASRYLTFTDPNTGVSIKLHGTVSWISSLAKGDKLVFDLLHVK